MELKILTKKEELLKSGAILDKPKLRERDWGSNEEVADPVKNNPLQDLGNAT